MDTNFIITDAIISDFTAIHEIYAYYVKHTTISFEEIPPTLEEMISRWKDYSEKQYPYIVAKIDGKVVGYAYACQYKPRTAYRFSVEESVYVSKDYQNKGIGRSLLSELTRRCEEKGYRQMLAVITITEDSSSVNFHQRLGFKQVGRLENVGLKFNKWIDTIIMQKSLSNPI